MHTTMETPNPKPCYTGGSNSACCYNEYRNKTSNTCIECPSGTYGWNCKSICRHGYYGQLCKSNCSCPRCNPVTGLGCDEELKTTIRTISLQSAITTAFTRDTQSSTENMVVKPNTPSNLTVPKDEHLSHELSITFSLIGLVLSMLFLGYIVYRRSRGMKSRCSPSLKRQFGQCVDSEYQRQENEGDMELSTVDQSPHCGQMEADLYAEIRNSQLAEGKDRMRSSKDTSSFLMSHAVFQKDRDVCILRNAKSYQQCKGNNQYDRVQLRVNGSGLFTDRMDSPSQDKDDKYIMLKNSKQPQNANEIDEKPDDPRPNLPVFTIQEHEGICSFIGDSARTVSTDGLLESPYTVEDVIENRSECHWVQQSATDNHSNHNGKRPYSLAQHLSENDLSGALEKHSNHMKNGSVFQNGGCTEQPGDRSYSFAKLQQ